MDTNSSVKSLPKTQAELLEAMRNGVEVRYMRYMGSFNPNAYYYRTDNLKRCTAPVKALLEKGLAEKVNVQRIGGDHQVRAKP